MLAPKEKAIKLIARFEPYCYHERVQCALIAVDEILNAIDWDYYEGAAQTEHKYWKEVKREIKAL